MISTIGLTEGVRSEARVADDGFGPSANLHIFDGRSEVLITASLTDLSSEEYFDALGLASDLEAFADALREAVS